MQDYYAILGLTKSATQEQIKKAFKQLVLKYHPDKHTNATEAQKKELSKKFMEIKQAYDVLSDEKKRKNYDAYGTEEPSFNPSDFFGQGFPSGTKFKTNFNFNETGFSDFFSSPFESFFKGETNFRKRENEAQEVKFKVSLDDLYKGCTKELKIQRNTFKGKETVNLRLTIKPGYKKGTKFTFREYGDQMSDGSYKDIKLVLDEIPDPNFRRENDDLYTTVHITLKELISGFTKVLLLPGGRKLTVTEKDVRTIGDQTVIPFMGMPIQNSASNRGSLRIIFLMTVPSLNLTQKEKIQSIL